MAVRPESRIGHYLDGHIQLVKILGVGAYGVVYAAIDLENNIPYAVKALSKVGPTGLPLDDAQKKFQAREISLHCQSHRHPNIVSVIEVLDAPDCIYVIMEFCPEGDLFAAITERQQYVGNDDLAKKVFLQLLDAVQWCHSNSIYHRDLKPENILVCDNGNSIRVADFGLATKEKYTSDFGCGSTFYMSPECHKRSSSTCYESGPNDVWSLGVILVNLTCGRNPWKRAEPRDETYAAYLRDPHFLQSILPLSNELDAILRRIFEPNPRRRITLPELRRAIIRCPRFTIYPSATSSPVIDEQEWSDAQDWQNIIIDDITINQFSPIFEEVPSFMSLKTPPTPITTPQRPPPLNLHGIRNIPKSHYPPTPTSPTCRPRHPRRTRQQIPRRRDNATQRRNHQEMSLSHSSSVASDRSLRFDYDYTPEDSPSPTPTSIRDAPLPPPRTLAEAFGLSFCNPVIDTLDQPFGLPPSRGVPVY